MKRRTLDFTDFGAVVRDLDGLTQHGYTKGGNWDLGQVCSHIAIFVRGSLDGFSGKRLPWFIRLVAPMFVRRMIKKRSMPEGMKLPPELVPPATQNEAAAVEALKGLLHRFDGHRGPLHASPFGGHSDYPTWRELHLIHCAHHLSFLHPKAGA